MKNEISSDYKYGILRWVRFNFVGVMGFLVQTISLYIFNLFKPFPIWLIYCFAIELAVLHNFIWHYNWTWKDCLQQTEPSALLQFLKFNLTNGAVSLICALFFVTWLYESKIYSLQFINIISTIACSVINFLLANVFVFCQKKRSVA